MVPPRDTFTLNCSSQSVHELQTDTNLQHEIKTVHFKETKEGKHCPPELGGGSLNADGGPQGQVVEEVVWPQGGAEDMAR